DVIRHDYTSGSTDMTDYYRYNPSDAAATLEIELSELFEADGSLKAIYTGDFNAVTGEDFDETNRDTGEYLSDFKNFDQTHRRWSEGGGYMKKKTVYNETTTTEGLKKYWDIGLRANHAIEIGFLESSATPTVLIESVGDVILSGDIRTAAHAEVSINNNFATPSKAFGANGGGVSATKNVSISGKLQAIRTNGTVDFVLINLVNTAAPAAFSSAAASSVAVPTDVQVLDIQVSSGDILIGLGSNTNDKGSVIIKELSTGSGTVAINAPQGIFAQAKAAGDTSAHITADRIELQSSQSVVGTEAQAVLIDTNHLVVDGGFAGAAALGMNVVEVAGDLHLVQPEEIRTDFLREDDPGPISAGTLTGILRLTALDGSILDYNFETDGSLTNARLAAYQARLGLTDGNRTIAGNQLDNQVVADYQLYVEYWNLIRTPAGSGPVDPDLNNVAAFNTLVTNTAAANPGMTEAQARAQQLARFDALHAVEYDQGFRNSDSYNRYFALIWSASESVALDQMSTFQALADDQLLSQFAGDFVDTYSGIHTVLAGRDVGASSAARIYVETIHADAASQPDLASNTAYQTYIADLTTGGATAVEIAAAEAEMAVLHDALWAAENARLQDYIDVVRFGAQAEGGKDSGGQYLDVWSQFLTRGTTAQVADDMELGNFDALVSGFDGAAARTAIEADLTYTYGVLHEANREATGPKASYVESLYLEGAAREAAIDAELASMTSLNQTLPAAVAKALYPLLEVGSISGAATAAAENANIIAPEVFLVAAGTDAGEGQIGTLTEPKDIDFTAPIELDATLSDAENQARLDAQNLRRALQVQDIVDVVHQIYVRTGGETVLADAPERGALEADTANWTKLDLIFSDMTDGNRPTVTLSNGQVLGLWNTWPGSADATAHTYRLFQYSGAGTGAIDPQSIDWDNPPSGWSELTTIKQVPEVGTVTVSNGDIFADLWDVQRVSARPFADVNLRATALNAATYLTMTSSSVAGIGHDGVELHIREANSGGFLRLLTTGSLIDASLSGTAAATASDYISLIADGAIGTGDQAFTINTLNDAVLLLQAGNDASIEQLGGDLNVQRALTGGDLELTVPQNLIVGDIDAGGTVKLNVGGNVSDFANGRCCVNSFNRQVIMHWKAFWIGGHHNASR
ncbi:MAG: hypothetical protein VX181_12590, partial [Pseudomonadota bacterium]|nr:hypothetical protein [Pseudomonadota bacterium]